MKFNSLKLTNWGPYVGEHFIDLSVTESAPVVVFYAENGHGKTSILSALKWGLYGKNIYKNDGRTVRPLETLVNLEALAAGDEVPFEVCIRVEHNSEELEVIRSGRATQSIDGIVKISNLAVTLKSRSGHPFAQDAIDEQINSMLNEEISEFFLFDGEMLGRFEERLKETDTSRVFVRKQVERALGLPFVKTLLDDFDAVELQVNKIIEAANRANKRTDQAREDHAKKSSDLENLTNDISAVLGMHESLESDVLQIESELAKVEPIREILFERQSTEKSLAQFERDLIDVEDQLKDVLEEAWWFPLEGRLRTDLEAIETSSEQSAAIAMQRMEIEVKLKNLQHSLSSEICSTCGQRLPDHDEAHIRNEIDLLEGRLSEIPDGGDYENLNERRRKLRVFASRASAVERIKNLETDVRKQKFRIDKDRQKLVSLNEQLAGERTDVAALDSQLRAKKLERERVGQALKDLEIDRRRMREDLGEIAKVLRESPDVDSKDRDLANLAEAAEEIIRKAFTSFSDEMRGRVEEHASHLFHRLSSEKEYESVRIGEDYSLKVLTTARRTDNATVELSAGFNQVLTVSFIGALGECSVDEAPLVMDTPFSRLDVGHRRAILDWVSEYKPQVILFTHSGEMVRDTDRAHLHDSIAREYLVKRKNAFSSEIRKLENE